MHLVVVRFNDGWPLLKQCRSESELIMRTLRDMNMSKFVAEDVPIFLSLVNDLFPGQNVEEAPSADVNSALHKVCAEKGLQPHPSWMRKCMQFYDTTLVRHGIMAVGPTGTGKSTAVSILVRFFNDHRLHSFLGAVLYNLLIHLWNAVLTFQICSMVY